ncbi:MAG: murein biosynthesis integral membrane protein MurJ [Micropepsaceae bacterium]
MFRSLLSVGGFTLISRASGFVRDIVMAAVLGHGVLSDAFLIAFRLPNHFRTIFAEGAYNAAFIPLYSSLSQESPAASRSFSRNMLGWQIAVQLVLLVVALAAMPWIVTALAPGFVARPEQMALAVELTRITFAYLLCVAVVTHLGDMLNAEKTFWPAAAAPVCLNLAMAAMLSVAFLFPTAGHAAAFGVLAGGVAEVLLLVGAAAARGLPVVPIWPKLSADVRLFAVRFGPAALGAAGVQLALFVDTILASFLAAGELTSLYYADRVNQLPMGVVGVALGTVLLPELSRAVAAKDEAKAARSFNRATEIGLLLTLPCAAVFFAFPDAIMKGLFARGAFDIEAANAAGAVLIAYAAGLPAFVLLRTVNPLFHSRGDTRTPVLATVASIVVNLAVKLVLIVSFSFGAVGLALGTAVGAWVNLGLLVVVASMRGLLRLDERMMGGAPRIIAAAVLAGVVSWLAAAPVAEALAGLSQLRNEITMVAMGAIALSSYGVALFGLGWKR